MVHGLRFKVKALGFGEYRLALRVQGLGPRVKGLGFKA